MCGLLIAFVCLLILGLGWVDEQMNVRYQAVGRLVDDSGQPLKGVEVLLLLAPPPPAGPRLDRLFVREGEVHGRRSTDGTLRRRIGPTVGLSGSSGAYIVRVMGRTGYSRAIRLGLDSGGKPPFETAWLLFRREGQPDIMRTVSILGWKSSPKGWGAFANRLPKIILE